VDVRKLYMRHFKIYVIFSTFFIQPQNSSGVINTAKTRGEYYTAKRNREIKPRGKKNKLGSFKGTVSPDYTDYNL
jgi:hypothetical protein